MNFFPKNAPGIFLSLGVAAVAYILGRFLPIVGGPVFGILLGSVRNIAESKLQSLIRIL